MARIVPAVGGHGDIPTGFPILVSERMAIIEPAFAYLIELATIPGRSHARDTVRTYGEHLHDWFDALEQSARDWASVDEADIASYRNRMSASASPHTGRAYAHATINARIRSICRFYGWAYAKGRIDALPFHFTDVRVRRCAGFLAHVGVRPAVIAANVLTLREHERLPRPLRADQVRALLMALPMPYRLMAEWSLTAGMRRKELCGLKLYQIPETAHLDDDDHPLIGVPITITKGDRPRTIYPPIRLIDRTQRYVDEIRTPLVRALRRKCADYKAPDALFLNSRGRAITRARLTAALAQGYGAAGVDGTLHWLRHTFAMTMLMRLQRIAVSAPDINPLKIVQVLLGHASIQSTAIYLRCVELHAEDLAQSLDYLYGEVIDAS